MNRLWGICNPAAGFAMGSACAKRGDFDRQPVAPSIFPIGGLSSEDPAHPIEHAFDGDGGPDATRWISARDNTVEHIVIEFDRPQEISYLSYEVEERAVERTQEVRGEISDDPGASYRQIFVQDYTFSPQGATYQHEEQRFDRVEADRLRLTIVPNKNGSGRATLTTLRLFT
jgi:F5/8 type C domain